MSLSLSLSLKHTHPCARTHKKKKHKLLSLLLPKIDRNGHLSCWQVDLEYLLERYPLEKEVNWGDELSLGEQQRLGMARLFYHKPKFAILDECTSAVTTDMEERFCCKVRAMGTSCITISHRPALAAFHDMVLSLDGEGGWSVHDKRFYFFFLSSVTFNVSVLHAYIGILLAFKTELL